MDSEIGLSVGLEANLRRKLQNLNYDCSKGLASACALFMKDHELKDTGELWAKLTELGGVMFSEAFQYELDAFDGLDPKGPREAELASVNARAHDSRLAGLAFSGGGIRSATFNLGVLQALAEMKLLRGFDYLSTVSGGGYIGGWLTKWISECRGEVRAVEDGLVAAKVAECPRTEPWPVQFLRRYSNYLTPRVGLFSADTWTLICTYARNTSLNMAMLFAILGAVFLLPRFAMLGVEQSDLARSGQWWTIAAIALFLWSVFRIALSISRKGRHPLDGPLAEHQGVVLRYICLPLVLAGFAGSVAAWANRRTLAGYWDALWDPLSNLPFLVIPGACYFGAWALGWSAAQLLNRPAQIMENPFGFLRSTAIQGIGHALSAAVALAVGSVLLLKGASLIEANAWGPLDSVQRVSFGMPLMMALFGLTITLMIGLVGRMYGDQSREWWARQGGWTVILAVSWLAVFASAFYLPPLLDWAWHAWLKTTATGTVLTSIAMLVGLKSGSDKDTGKEGSARWKELVAQAAPYAFTLLTIAALTTVLQWLVAPEPVIPKGSEKNLAAYFEAYAAASESTSLLIPGAQPETPPFGLAALWAGLVAVAAVLNWRVDVNKFSLYMMYRLRLVRAYFGASSGAREPHPFTGFDPCDDPSLAAMRMKTDADGVPTAEVQRPFHLINAAVNIVGGKELAWQTRKAGNFCFSPAYCGFELPQLPADGRRQASPRGAFRQTADYASKAGPFKDEDSGVKLGMAIAVSGAAASPNMGYHSSPPLSFLMTLFNLRLGRWSPNPVREKVWKQASPHSGMASILLELLGLTDTSADFLYLSDGGHFENLGIYELVRRRCHLIVVVDASCDRENAFGDLGNAVRKCLTDFNIPIELDAGRIKPLSATTTQGVTAVTGTIRYSQADGNKVCDGVLLYIKPTLIGGENADVLNYSKMHPEFPHQSTGDQWFDEDQFESYRTLGYRAVRSALRGIADDPSRIRTVATDPVREGKERIEAISRLLLRRKEQRSDNVTPLRRHNARTHSVWREKHA
ncbi:hypothetical protein [Massilia sp. ST3]|uniref:hypothetical protein n=1 Tax=Massilia sp. ST3 TaxID=2824903 RepID=UPI001E558658|nr:hypothetical protein [Massilia sp. ST3]